MKKKKKMEEKWRKNETVFASGTENKDESIRELEGKNLLLDPWYVLVHGTGPYKVGQPNRGLHLLSKGRASVRG